MIPCDIAIMEEWRRKCFGRCWFCLRQNALLRLLHSSFTACTLTIQMPTLFCFRLHLTGKKNIQDGNLEPPYSSGIYKLFYFPKFYRAEKIFNKGSYSP